ncbi:nucleoside hydrolase [Oscillibacter valericigenes]|uniref:nucleoside hydrolase n=1 Tax=Oscillibacter ruminantium TaxID=1263547 RepID=UPI0002FCEA9B|nr:nucleoside hydrolase [Oscillibacter ruminantium]MDN0033599.1 nucleoside hydrolase [Oscillibacter valericigenes]
MNKIPIWFDTDLGVDDAVALLSIGKLPQLELLGISAVAGNAELHHTFENARNVCRLAGLNVPVYPGAEYPLFVPLRTAPLVHGENGVGEVELSPSEAPRETTLAWDALYKAAKAARGELQVIAVGPLTNLATALGKYPDLKTLLKRILLMGGAAQGGNVTPAAEFNIYGDPHAAQMVFKSGVPVVMCGLDVTLKAYLTPEEVDEIGSHDTPVCRFVHQSNQLALAFNERISAPGLCCHDTCPVLFLACPELFSGEEAGVYVETRGEVTLGKTVTDLWSDKQFADRHVFVVLNVDREKFIAKVRELLLSY